MQSFRGVCKGATCETYDGLTTVLSFTCESHSLRKTVFILRQGPDAVDSRWWTAMRKRHWKRQIFCFLNPQSTWSIIWEKTLGTKKMTSLSPWSYFDKFAWIKLIKSDILIKARPRFQETPFRFYILFIYDLMHIIVSGSGFYQIWVWCNQTGP